MASISERLACMRRLRNRVIEANAAMRKDAQLIRNGVFGLLAIALIASFMFIFVGCGSDGTPQGAIVGRDGKYNYSPSVIQTGDVQQFWWCGFGKYSTDASESSDIILYESISTISHATYGPVVVLGETNGGWDSKFTCNPRVIRGTFVNPLSNGQTYTYEMFYVGSTSGIDNSIGAAFSNDGIQWTKYPEPVILSSSQVRYGVGQPAAYNADGRSNITLVYEDDTPSVHHVEATSTDGIHFVVQGTITAKGIDPANPDPRWGDMGYDPVTRDWYAAFDLPVRSPSTTGDVVEQGQYGFQLYRIPGSSLLTGSTPWQMLKTVDTNLTGYETNFLPSLLHDRYGNINIGSYPTLQLFVSTAIPRPAWDASPVSAGNAAVLWQWAIAVNNYNPDETTLALHRYLNGTTYQVTSGWTDPSAHFVLDTSIAHLYAAPQNGANQAFYGCKEGSTGYFVSLDPACNGQRILGVNGYGYAKQPTGVATVALYSCTSTQKGRFLSKDPACEGSGTGALLAYGLP